MQIRKSQPIRMTLGGEGESIDGATITNSTISNSIINSSVLNNPTFGGTVSAIGTINNYTNAQITADSGNISVEDTYIHGTRGRFELTNYTIDLANPTETIENGTTALNSHTITGSESSVTLNAGTIALGNNTITPNANTINSSLNTINSNQDIITLTDGAITGSGTELNGFQPILNGYAPVLRCIADSAMQANRLVYPNSYDVDTGMLHLYNASDSVSGWFITGMTLHDANEGDIVLVQCSGIMRGVAGGTNINFGTRVAAFNGGLVNMTSSQSPFFALQKPAAVGDLIYIIRMF